MSVRDIRNSFNKHVKPLVKHEDSSKGSEHRHGYLTVEDRGDVDKYLDKCGDVFDDHRGEEPSKADLEALLDDLFDTTEYFLEGPVTHELRKAAVDHFKSFLSAVSEDHDVSSAKRQRLESDLEQIVHEQHKKDLEQTIKSAKTDKSSNNASSNRTRSNTKDRTTTSKGSPDSFSMFDWLTETGIRSFKPLLFAKPLFYFTAFLISLSFLWVNLPFLSEDHLWVLPLIGIPVTAYYTVKQGFNVLKSLKILWDQWYKGIRILLLIGLVACLLFYPSTIKSETVNGVATVADLASDKLSVADQNTTAFLRAKVNTTFQALNSSNHDDLLNIPEDDGDETGALIITDDGTDSDSQDSITATSTALSTRTIEDKIVEYTNEERKQRGLEPLQRNEALADVARKHSQDMAENDFFSHDNLAGEDPTERAKEAGLRVKEQVGRTIYTGIAENIGKMATGQLTDGRYIDNEADAVAKATVEDWMNSEGHRENILTSRYDEIGVGVAYDGTHHIATQNFR